MYAIQRVRRCYGDERGMADISSVHRLIACMLTDAGHVHGGNLLEQHLLQICQWRVMVTNNIRPREAADPYSVSIIGQYDARKMNGPAIARLYAYLHSQAAEHC